MLEPLHKTPEAAFAYLMEQRDDCQDGSVAVIASIPLGCDRAALGYRYVRTDNGLSPRQQLGYALVERHAAGWHVASGGEIGVARLQAGQQLDCLLGTNMPDQPPVTLVIGRVRQPEIAHVTVAFGDAPMVEATLVGNCFCVGGAYNRADIDITAYAATGQILQRFDHQQPTIEQLIPKHLRP